MASLQCDPFFTNWSSLGTVHTYGRIVIPGAVYELEAVDDTCDAGGGPVNFSPALVIENPRWGDLAGPFVLQLEQWSVPDGTADIGVDVPALLAAFLGKPGAPDKFRADWEGTNPADRSLLDGVVNVGEVVRGIDAFKGKLYPFDPPVIPPCGL